MDDPTATHEPVLVEVVLAGGFVVTVVVPVEGRPDLEVVDALAQLCLAARRINARPSLRRVPEPLVELLALSGLRRACPTDPSAT